jgi:hypothetical protein
MRGILLLILFLMAYAGYSQQAKPLQFREETYDFGDVQEKGGPVTHEFTYSNTSNRPIKILSVQASCGCTTPAWSKEPILPGKTGFIQASFNPQGRPGHFLKSLTVTSDFDGNAITLQIKGQVISTEGSIESLPVAKGNLSFKASSFNLGKVFLVDEFVTKEFPVANNGEKAINFQRAVSPSYIKASIEPAVLNPGQQGIIKIGYNGKLKAQYGFQSDNIELYTDDAQEPVKSFSVYATLQEYFPKLSNEELAKAPVLKIIETSFDIGRINQHGQVSRDVSIVNRGTKDLVIRSIQPNCTCVVATISKNELQSGEAATIKISFSPQDRKGSQQKGVTVYSNDPRNPVQRITFTAYVED